MSDHRAAAGQFRKRPVVIEAMQYDGYNAWQIERWAMAVGGWVKPSPVLEPGPDNPVGGYLQIKTLEGIMVANPGDWIIRGVKDEFYPCKPDIFEATYERI